MEHVEGTPWREGGVEPAVETRGVAYIVDLGDGADLVGGWGFPVPEGVPRILIRDEEDEVVLGDVVDEEAPGVVDAREVVEAACKVRCVSFGEDGGIEQTIGVDGIRDPYPNPPSSSPLDPGDR